MNSHKTRLQPGIDDPLLSQLDDSRSKSGWTATALEVFFQEFGADQLGECIGDPKQVYAYNADLPKWAEAYLGRIDNYKKSRLIRSAMWFYLGRLSITTIDVNQLLERVVKIASGKDWALDEEPGKPMSEEEQNLVKTLVSQF